MEIKQTERGWAGHFICSDRCFFRRNTLIERGSTKIVISTVGNFFPTREKIQLGEPEEIGANRFYETKAFYAVEEDGFIEADTEKEISLGVPWSIGEKHKDNEANKMHDDAVAWIVKMAEERKL